MFRESPKVSEAWVLALPPSSARNSNNLGPGNPRTGPAGPFFAGSGPPGRRRSGGCNRSPPPLPSACCPGSSPWLSSWSRWTRRSSTRPSRRSPRPSTWRPLSMKSALTSYMLSLAVFIPISGWVADRYGTRRVFASAIGVFTLGSLLCGSPTNIHFLVACRILQGCGGAMMVPVGRLTLVRTFARSELVRAMSFVAIPGADRPAPRPAGRRPDRRLLPLAADLFRQPPDRDPRALSGLAPPPRLPRGADGSPGFRRPGPLRLRRSPSFPTSWRSSASTSLSPAEIAGLLGVALALLLAYWTTRRPAPLPLLRLRLFRIRTFRRPSSAELRHPARAWAACPSSFPSSTRSARIHARPVRPAHHAPAPGGHEPEVHHALGPDRLRLPAASS